jgi:hypothetical protein
MSLALIEEIKSEFRINDLGQCTVSLRGAARIVGIKQQTLTTHFQSDSLKPSKMAEKLSGLGFKGDSLAAFSKSGIPDIALSSIIEYYAFEAGRYCTEQALRIYRMFAAIGVRAWIQSELGWKPPQIAVPSDSNPLHVLELAAQQMAASGCDANIVGQWKIDQYAKLYPQISGGLRQAKAIISASTDFEVLPVNPTRLGQLLAQQLKLAKDVSAERVNQEIEKLGFQLRGADKSWKLTDKGKQYGHLQQVVVNGTPRSQIRWDVEILNCLKDLFG